MKIRNLIAGVLAGVILLTGCTPESSSSSKASGTGSSKDTSVSTPSNDTAPIQLTAYSQLANYSGKVTGWSAKILKDKFNVEMTIIPNPDGTFDTRMESGNLGDIVIFGSNGEEYQRAVKGGMLFDWNEDNILADFGPYILENMSKALDNNANMTKSITDGDPVVYGFGHNIATSTDNHEEFFYTWDIRWDLYKQLEYPAVKNIDDLYDLFVAMKEISPTDDNGNETYAVSLWPDWDGNMVMYVKSLASAYWGHDEMGFGHYDVNTGEFYYSMDENSMYLQSLAFFNKLYRNKLLDPSSMTQTYDEMGQKVSAGGTFFSIFNFSGQSIFNSEENTAAGKYMYTLTPDDATPIAYGMNVLGGNRVWTIGANTEYPELCMEIINYLATPEGFMTYWYGPKDLCWYYDDDGLTQFTEYGKTAYKDKINTMVPDEWGGGSFDKGALQVNNNTWTIDANNPDSSGDTYNASQWRSNRTGATSDIQQDWMDFTGFYDTTEYLDNKPYKLSMATSYKESSRSADLKLIWEQVATAIVDYSWKAIYAKDDAEYNSIVAEMIKKVKQYDPDDLCLQWCIEEAAIRKALDDQVRGN